MAFEIEVQCGACGGDGIVDAWGIPPTNTQCWACGGSGTLVFGGLSDIADRMDDLEAKLDDVINLCNDIKELVSG